MGMSMLFVIVIVPVSARLILLIIFLIVVVCIKGCLRGCELRQG